MSDAAPPLRSARATFDAGALGRGLVIPGLLVVAWTVVTHGGFVSNNLLMPIERIVALPFNDEAGRHLWSALLASIMRLVLGFAIGALAQVALGGLMGASRAADRAVGPSFNALRQITLFAWIPLLTAWFGNGDVPKIVYVAMSAFFPAALNSYIGLRSISAQYFEVASVLRLSQLTRIRKLLLPGALPSIFVGLQIALISAWLGTVSSEYAMGNGRGLGGFLLEGRGQFRMDVVVLGVVVLALVGYLINVGCTKVFHHLLVWQGESR